MRRLLPVFLVALAAYAAPAAAIDLTGTWQDTKHSACTGLNAAGEKVALGSRSFSFYDLPITQTGDNLSLNVGAYIWFFDGRVYQETGGTKGQGVLQKCPGGVPNALVTFRILKAQTSEPNAKGVSGKMTTLYIYASDLETYSCTVTWQRVSMVDPESVPCP
jgi:hypothetical protein